MSRKKQAPKKIFYPDAKYNSVILAKFINFIMYDGKKTTAEKIIYSALDRIKEKTKEDPIKVFNDAINNIRPNLEVRSRRVGVLLIKSPQKLKPKDLKHQHFVGFQKLQEKEKIKQCLINYLMN